MKVSKSKRKMIFYLTKLEEAKQYTRVLHHSCWFDGSIDKTS
jgi:hypothetical protein